MSGSDSSWSLGPARAAAHDAASALRDTSLATGRDRLRGWSQRRDSNPQPPDYKSGALPIELRWRLGPRGPVEPAQPSAGRRLHRAASAARAGAPFDEGSEECRERLAAVKVPPLKSTGTERIQRHWTSTGLGQGSAPASLGRSHAWPLELRQQALLPGAGFSLPQRRPHRMRAAVLRLSQAQRTSSKRLEAGLVARHSPLDGGHGRPPALL